MDKAGIEYQQDYCEGIYSTDFLIEKDGKRIAVECKADVGRDLEKTFAICEQLKAHFHSVRVLIVVPYLDNGTITDAVAVSEIGAELRTSLNLSDT